MGYNSRPEVVMTLLACMRDGLAQQVCGNGVRACMRVWEVQCFAVSED